MPTRAGSTNSVPLALTMGEPGGVGGEIAMKAWRSLRKTDCVFFLIDDPARLRKIAKGGEAIAAIDDPANAATVFAKALPVFPVGATINATPGKSDPANASLVISAIETAVRLTLEGAASGVVTNPIQKASLLGSGFMFPGHTEFLAQLTEGAPMPAGVTRGPVMMLAGPDLKTVPVTVHMQLSQAILSLDTEKIVKTARVTAESLARDWGIAAPRLAIAGLNPHAGEAGELGAEDDAIVTPAVAALRASGIDARGPLPADTLFHEEARATYDAALCMYHDQALIPAKTLAFHDAVNVTLGLPIIRTSPDHGTALDIAGTETARPDSLIAAIKLAGRMAANRSA